MFGRFNNLNYSKIQGSHFLTEKDFRPYTKAGDVAKAGFMDMFEDSGTAAILTRHLAVEKLAKDRVLADENMNADYLSRKTKKEVKKPFGQSGGIAYSGGHYSYNNYLTEFHGLTKDELIEQGFKFAETSSLTANAKMSIEEARVKEIQFDNRIKRAELIADAKPGLTTTVFGFGGGLAGGLLDPINAIPFGRGFGAGVKLFTPQMAGGAVKTAMAKHGVKKMVGMGVVDGAVGTMAANAIIYPDSNKAGMQLTGKDFAAEALMGGAFGGVLAGIGGAIGYRKARNQHADSMNLAAMQAANGDKIDVTNVIDDILKGDSKLFTANDNKIGINGNLEIKKLNNAEIKEFKGEWKAKAESLYKDLPSVKAKKAIRSQGLISRESLIENNVDVDTIQKLEKAKLIAKDENMAQALTVDDALDLTGFKNIDEMAMEIANTQPLKYFKSEHIRAEKNHLEIKNAYIESVTNDYRGKWEEQGKTDYYNAGLERLNRIKGIVEDGGLNEKHLLELIGEKEVLKLKNINEKLVSEAGTIKPESIGEIERLWDIANPKSKKDFISNRISQEKLKLNDNEYLKEMYTNNETDIFHNTKEAGSELDFNRQITEVEEAKFLDDVKSGKVTEEDYQEYKQVSDELIRAEAINKAYLQAADCVIGV